MGAGPRVERTYREMTIGQKTRNPALTDWALGEIGRAHLGLPRAFVMQNV